MDEDPSTSELYQIKLFVLGQAFEEGRYHKRFHHKLVGITSTFYLALLGIQVQYPEMLSDLPTYVSVYLVMLLFVAIPAYTNYLILDYHKAIARTNVLIHKRLRDLMTKEAVEFDSALAYKKYRKYEEAFHQGKNLLWVGKGHWYFLVLVDSLVLINLIFAFENIVV